MVSSKKVDNILPSYQKNYSNWMAILITLKSTSLDETVKCIKEWFILTGKIWELVISSVQQVLRFYVFTHSSVLNLAFVIFLHFTLIDTSMDEWKCVLMI